MNGYRRLLRCQDQFLGAPGARRAWRADRHYPTRQARCSANADHEIERGESVDRYGKTARAAQRDQPWRAVLEGIARRGSQVLIMLVVDASIALTWCFEDEV